MCIRDSLVDIHLGESENSDTTAKTSYVELMEGEKELMAGQKARTIGQGIYPCTYRNVPVQTLGVEAGNVNMDGTGEWTKCGGGRRFRDGLRHRCFEEELAGRNEGTVAVTFACLMLRACDTGTGDLSIDQKQGRFRAECSVVGSSDALVYGQMQCVSWCRVLVVANK